MILTFTGAELFAQFNIPGILKRKVEEKTEETIEKALEGEEEKTDEVEKKDIPESNQNVSAPVSQLKAYSKFDFVPGEKIIFFDDFSEDQIGDFPSKWNTNGSGEVVTTDKYPGKWFKILNQSFYVPDIKYPFPENYTLEFDLISQFELANQNIGNFCGTFRFDLESMVKPKLAIKSDEIHSYENPVYVSLTFDLIFGGNGTFSIINSFHGERGDIANNVELNYMKDKHGVPIHFAVSVNKQRLRFWVNENKVFDIPRVMGTEPLNILRLNPFSINPDKQYNLLISNVRFAEGVVDTRSKLLTEGKVVTNAITFDVASDKIKPESYNAIKSIASVLNENPDVKITIIGHTDNDGKADANIILSQKRAESVKNVLVNEFKIDAARINTDGKGADIPVADNTSAEGKAQNRRVEFIKL